MHEKQSNTISSKKNVLFSQRSTISLNSQHPLILYQFLWDTRATQDDKDDEIDKAEADLKAPFDPSVPITVWFEEKQDARYRLKELGEPDKANDKSMIRTVLLGPNIHEERQKGVKKFREEQERLASLPTPREATWEEAKRHLQDDSRSPADEETNTSWYYMTLTVTLSIQQP